MNQQEMLTLVYKAITALETETGYPTTPVAVRDRLKQQYSLDFSLDEVRIAMQIVYQHQAMNASRGSISA